MLGDLLYANSAPAWTKLTGNTTTTKKFLTQTGNGSASAAPGWGTIAAGDLPTHTHAESDVTSLVTDLAAKEATANKNAANGYAGLTASTKVNAAQIQEVISSADLTDFASKSGSGTTILGTTITSPGTTHYLGWSGSNWVNRAIASGDLPSHNHAESDVTNLVTDLSGKVPATRNVSTSSPLGGGGALSADLTLTCATCEVTGHKDAANGYAGLSGSSKIAASEVQEVLGAADLTDYSATSGSGSTAIKATITSPSSNDVLTWNGSNWINQAPSGGSSHNLLSATHPDTTAATVTRGDLVTGQGATPKWTRLAKGTAGQCLQMDGSAADIVWGSCAAGGGASTALDNLASVAVNLSLLPGTDNSIDLGSASKQWKDAYLSGTATFGGAGDFTLTATGTNANVKLAPNGSGDVLPAATGKDLGSATLPFAEFYFSGTSSTPATNNFKLTGASTSGTRTITAPDSAAIIPQAYSCTTQVATALSGTTGATTCSTVASAHLATANKTIEKSINIFSPTTSDTNKVQIYFGQAVTITRVACSTDTGTVTIQLDERAEATPNTAGTDVMSATLTCDTDSQVTTSFSNAGIAADAPLNLQVTATAGTPGVVRIHVKATIN